MVFDAAKMQKCKAKNVKVKFHLVFFPLAKTKYLLCHRDTKISIAGADLVVFIDVFRWYFSFSFFSCLCFVTKHQNSMHFYRQALVFVRNQHFMLKIYSIFFHALRMFSLVLTLSKALCHDVDILNFVLSHFSRCAFAFSSLPFCSVNLKL